MHRLLFVIALLLVRGSTAGAQTGPQVTLPLSDVFGYDTNLALDAVVTTQSVGPPARLHVLYTSAHDKRVPAILSLPPGGGPSPAVIMLHGLGDNKGVSYITRTADLLSSIGVASLAIDAEYAGERKTEGRSRGIVLPTSYVNRDAMIQTVVDLRRAIDFLETRRDIDASRIGYVGFSQGAMLGTAFCALDTRVKAVCLVVGGGGFLDAIPLLKRQALALRLAQIMDPIHHVGMIAPRPLLMLNGKDDKIVSRASSEALFNAAGEPKEIIWYDAGHFVTADPKRDPFDDLIRFIREKLLAPK